MEIRRSYDRLISTMGLPILVRCHLYIESGPRTRSVCRSQQIGWCGWLPKCKLFLDLWAVYVVHQGLAFAGNYCGNWRGGAIFLSIHSTDAIVLLISYMDGNSILGHRTGETDILTQPAAESCSDSSSTVDVRNILQLHFNQNMNISSE